MVNAFNELVNQEEPFEPIASTGFTSQSVRIKSLSDVCVVTLLISALLVLGHGNTIVEPPAEKRSFTTLVKGKVVPKHRIENNYVLVYFGSLNRGVGTDSSGYYVLHFTDSDSVHDGAIRIYHFVNQYELDSVCVVCTRRIK